MALPSPQSVGRVALALSALTFVAFFLNVLVGGPLGRKPWMSDVSEMLTLFVAVVFFVVGTICREAESNRIRSAP
jgi:Kef-type K+ transport system membrane component KefB